MTSNNTIQPMESTTYCRFSHKNMYKFVQLIIYRKMFPVNPTLAVTIHTEICTKYIPLLIFATQFECIFPYNTSLCIDFFHGTEKETESSLHVLLIFLLSTCLPSDIFLNTICRHDPAENNPYFPFSTFVKTTLILVVIFLLQRPFLNYF